MEYVEFFLLLISVASGIGRTCPFSLIEVLRRRVTQQPFARLERILLKLPKYAARAF